MKRARTEDCPSEEALCGFADGSLQNGREEVETHLAGCEPCLDVVTELVLSARALAGGELEAVPLELERRAQGRTPLAGESARRIPWLARIGDLVFSYRAAGVLAAASLVALVVVLGNPRERFPGDGPSGTRAGAAFTTAPVPVEPRGEIRGGESVTFRWEPSPGIERYVITIVDAEAGRVVTREAVSSAEYTLPGERLAASDGNHFEWTVECTLADGRVAISPAVAFVVGSSPAGE